MRIAAKRLRYMLEVTAPVLRRPTPQTAAKRAKDLQDLLGEIHDCDVQLPEVAAFLDELRPRTPTALRAARRRRRRLDPALCAGRRTARAYAGLAALAVHLRARRALLFDRFLELWRELQRKGFRARLEYAVDGTLRRRSRLPTAASDLHGRDAMPQQPRRRRRPPSRT